MCYYSKTIEWRLKCANHLFGEYPWMNGGEVFVFDDKFIWFDFNVGLIVWDNPLSVEK